VAPCDGVGCSAVGGAGQGGRGLHPHLKAGIYTRYAPVRARRHSETVTV
jgi:hypothetical protein